MKLAALLMFVTDVHALGLDVAQGLNLTESFYWDLNDRTRAFTSRVKPKAPNNWPNMIHAGCSSATLHYLEDNHGHGWGGGEAEWYRYGRANEKDAG